MSSWRFKFKCTVWHALFSTCVGFIALSVIFGLWYPTPYAQMLGVWHIVSLAVLVDVVSGPMLTAILAHPKKSRRERWADFALVGGLQCAALLYALHAVYTVRPVAVVFEVDRFVVVSANEVQTAQLPNFVLQVEQLPRFSRLLLGVRDLGEEDDLFASVQQSMAGFGPATRPSWWRPYDEVRLQVKERMRPVSLLQKAYSTHSGLMQAIKNTSLRPEDLSFLPLTTSREKNWVVLMNAKGDLLTHAQVDGFLMPASGPSGAGEAGTRGSGKQ